MQYLFGLFLFFTISLQALGNTQSYQSALKTLKMSAPWVAPKVDLAEILLLSQSENPEITQKTKELCESGDSSLAKIFSEKP